MSGEPVVTIMGNLTGDPELRFTPSGAAVANFTVASTPQTKDQQSQQWVDGETMFVRVSAWRTMAENVAESLHRGDRVVVAGRMKVRTWQPQDGPARLGIEMDADEVGTSLKFATAKPERAQRSTPGGPQGGPAPDPWTTQGQPAAAPPGYGQPAQGYPQGGALGYGAPQQGTWQGQPVPTQDPPPF